MKYGSVVGEKMNYINTVHCSFAAECHQVWLRSVRTTALRLAISGRAAAQHLTSIRFSRNKEFGITRDPQCFCVSHSHFDS